MIEAPSTTIPSFVCVSCMAPWLDHAIADTLLSHDFSYYYTAADNVELYVGIAVSVGLVMIAATVLLLLVMHKKRAKKHKQSSKLNIHRICMKTLNWIITSDLESQKSGYYEEINVEAIISSTQEPVYTTIEESTDLNIDLTQNKAYGGVITAGDNSNVNEGMGRNKVTMKATKQPQITQLTYNNIANPSPVSHDPPTTIEESTDSNSNLTQNKAYGDVITTGDNSNVNKIMGGINEVTMKTNKLYGTTKQLQMAQLTYDNLANPSPVSHDSSERGIH